VGVGRFAQALSLLLDSRFVQAGNGQYHHAVACALAGVGRLPEAAEAARRAMELNEANEAIATFARTVRSLAELEATPIQRLTGQPVSD